MQLFFHPVYPNVWVALAQSASFFHGNPNVVPWNMQLMLTRDSANTWTKQDTYVQAFSFVPPDHAKKEVLCIWTSHDTKSGPQNQYAFDDVTFHMSDDLFATIVPLTKGVTGFTVFLPPSRPPFLSFFPDPNSSYLSYSTGDTSLWFPCYPKRVPTSKTCWSDLAKISTLQKFRPMSPIMRLLC
eukprot:TRINITY_DN3597_c0_g1_i3.p1 TRINITY_DN3597_c0_g1~~TRINITY_DN3597_c0_g1_i3.p1  ORF type:complete len:213 (-),score=23.59 TRINITY_DN3597_c0_g1_i3:763-1314(-)